MLTHNYRFQFERTIQNNDFDGWREALKEVHKLEEMVDDCFSDAYFLYKKEKFHYELAEESDPFPSVSKFSRWMERENDTFILDVIEKIPTGNFTFEKGKRIAQIVVVVTYK